MKTALEIILFVALTLGPIAALWFRVEREKRRRTRVGEDVDDYPRRNPMPPTSGG